MAHKDHKVTPAQRATLARLAHVARLALQAHAVRPANLAQRGSLVLTAP